LACRVVGRKTPAADARRWAVGSMNNVIWRRIISVVLLVGAICASTSLTYTQSSANAVAEPPVFQGGLWTDEFSNPSQVSDEYNTEVHGDRLLLKLVEYLDWTQTWTAHFAAGDFFQTEAISDTVRLAPNNSGQYFTTGAYTSTVFDAGRAVDWSSTGWAYSGVPYSVTVAFRTGNTSIPDSSWSAWSFPQFRPGVVGEFYCVYIINTNETHCESSMVGIESSQYIQYRITFNSSDPNTTIEFFDMSFIYGIHPVIGTATSETVSPIDLLAWKRLFYTSTVPISTSLVIDVLAPDGIVLMSNVHSGADLSSIQDASIKLRTTFTTTDTSHTPELDTWGLEWSVRWRSYLPIILR